MEVPPFHHHRYVPPPSNFSESPNFYHHPQSHHRLPAPAQQHHHQHHQQPPPLPHLPPPSAPQHHRPHLRPQLPPPPPLPTPPQSQFKFRPRHHAIDPVPSPSPGPAPSGQFSNFIPPHLLNQPARPPLSPHRVPSNHQYDHRHRNPSFYNENSRFSDPWLDLPAPARAPVEPDFRYQPQQQRRPLSPLPPRTDSYVMRDFDGSARYRDDGISEGFRNAANPEIPLWGEWKERDFEVVDDGNDYRYHSGHPGFERNISPGFERGIDRINRDIVAADSRDICISQSPSRNFSLNVGNYESYNDRADDLRWAYSRLEKDHEHVEDDRVSLASYGVRRELFDSCYDDDDRLSSDRVEEELYSRSLRKKQVQKKSALLRIQLGKGNNRNNNRNKSHDNSRYSRAYYDDSKLSFGGSFKGKEKDDFVHPDWKTEGQREKSPVELDVSFKSNALVAKAIKATSSPMAEPDKSLAPRNRKLKKINSNDGQGIKMSENSVKAASFASELDASSFSDKDHKESSDKIISFKPDTSTGGLDSLLSSDKRGKGSAEKVIVVKTDNSAPGLDFPSGSGKDLEVLTEETSVCDCRTDVVEENNAGNESLALVCSDQGVKRVAPDGVHLQRARKKKTVRVSIQNETTNVDNSSTSSQSAASDLDEGVTLLRDSTSSAGLDATNDVLSPSLTNDLAVEEVNNSSENVVSDIKEDGVGISPSQKIPSQFSALLSVSLNPGDTDLHGGSRNEDKVVDNELFGLNSDKDLIESQNTFVPSCMGDPDAAVELPCLNGSLLVENDLLREDILSVHSNVSLSTLKENEVHDGQIDASTSTLNACSASTLCKSPGSMPIAHKGYIDTGSEEFVPLQVNVSHENDNDRDSPHPNLLVTDVGILGPSKIEKPTTCEVAENHDLYDNSLNCPASSKSFFSDPLGKSAASDTCLLEDSGKQSIAGCATSLPLNAPRERFPRSMVSHSPKVGRKRKARDDQPGIHDKLTSEADGFIASALDDGDRSSTLWVAKNLVSAEEEIGLGNGSNGVETGCPEEGPPEFNPSVQSGKKRKGFSLTLPSPALSEISQDPKDATQPGCLSDAEEHTIQPEDRVDLSSSCDTAFAGVTPYSEASVILLREDVTAGESYQSPGGGTRGHSAILENEMPSPAKLEADKNDNASSSLSASALQIADDTLSGSGEGNFIRSDMNEKQCFGDADHANHLILEETLAARGNTSLCSDLGGVSASSSTDRQMDSVPDTLSCMGSPEDVISSISTGMLNDGTRLSNLSEIIEGKDPISNKNLISGGDMIPLSVKPPSHTSKRGTKLGDAVPLDLAVDIKAPSLLSRKTFKVTQDSNPLPKKSSLTTNVPNSSFIGNFSGPTSIKYPSASKVSPFNHVARPRTWHRTLSSSPSIKYPSASKVSPFNHVARPRTWHRTLSSSPSVVGQKPHGNCIQPQTNNKKEVAKVQSSYVRRGNSLVRKPSPVVATPQGVKASRSSIGHLDSGIHDMRKGGGSENTTRVVDPPGSASLDASNACPVRPKTPPLISSVKLLDCLAPNPGDLTFSLLADQPINKCPFETPCKSSEHMNTGRSSQDEAKSSFNGCQTGVGKDSDCQNNADESSNGKKILYVKRKSNQLVAASDSDDISLHSAEKAQVLSSGGYYKRRKNQLIRTSLEEGVRQRVVPDKILSLQQQDAQKNIQTRCSNKRLPAGKIWLPLLTLAGFMKKKFSLVWTLCGTMSSKKDGSSERWQRVLPYLFPWRRATYWTNFMHSLSSVPIDSAASTVGQKLLLSRKRDAIYKKSISGFSLRRSKVLSVGGRSLKWSKSIERKSRKANEDATLAVVAAEKRKRARNGERIFRIGSERYRMDPTRKTLQRISDERPSYSDDPTENKRKKFYVPRRLLIGSDEYIRIGNGNQLVRDPKRRIRILANEKVRWSLHTARLRLARKKKYCQFFTRFGKCNKDDKKCPYIHDPSKIAVCTKFLNGSCSNPDCKLTHQVIPERMQDCSYFLQGLCSNESCPYRHVNVNPNSPICEGFLRGYCADGNECQKKHTYVCPAFEATGDCPQGPKCKLHHPKKKRKGMKRKAASVQKNARGRYFGAKPPDIAVSKAAVSEIISGKGDDIFAQDGKFSDYISLDVSIEEMERSFELRSEPTYYNEEPSHMEEAEVDELIKPVRIMNKNLITASSPAVNSSSDMTTSYVSEESLL
ncbi:uncharacterized protein [Coffea arabica]|uniref:Uncharacterized protein isoform X4 n=1 Tax=Coffea arabica TaxID=13443 RepID=A0ABM4VWC1_COFAR